MKNELGPDKCNFLGSPFLSIRMRDDVFSTCGFNPIDSRRMYNARISGAVEKEEIFTIAKGLTEYVRDQQINDIVLIDRSARPVYAIFNEYWKRAFPQDKKPNVYFVNPFGFRGEDDEEKLKQSYKRLTSEKDKKVLLFDTCVHYGDASRNILGAFREIFGEENVKFGVIQNTDNESEIKPDIAIFPFKPSMKCTPVGIDELVEKESLCFTSAPTVYRDDRLRAIELRKQLRKIIRDRSTTKGYIIPDKKEVREDSVKAASLVVGLAINPFGFLR